MQFKTDRVKSDFGQLDVHNPRLKSLIEAADAFVKLEFVKELTLTDIYRSVEEYKALYAANPAAIPKSSPHTKWQAVDLRSSVFTPREIERLLAFFNQFTFYGKQRPVAIYHTISGNVMHFHVQYGNDTP